jgi:phosphate/phosphite/phosphonate ABC transporter binding protein
VAAPVPVAGLRFGVTPYLPADVTERETAPLTEYLSRSLGVPVSLVVARSYDELASSVVSGDIDVASLPPLAFVKARRSQAGLQPLASMVRRGTVDYSSYLVARNDSGIRTLDDLRGKRFAYVDRSSASGFLLPRAALRARGHDPDAFFGEVLFAGDHVTALEWVLDGKVDSAATFSGVLAFAREEKGIATGGLRIVFKTGRVPHDAVVARAGLPGPVCDAIKASLLSVSSRTDAGRKVLGRALRINGWVSFEASRFDELDRILDAEGGRQ